MKKIGITTTVPVEVLIAAGYEVVDLNNIFITSSDYGKYIEIAENDGFPKSCCAWKKGIYGVCMRHGIEEVVGVTEGDCSNTKALEEVLRAKGIKVYPFAYPQSHDIKDIKISIDKFMGIFEVGFLEVEKVRERLKAVRDMVKKIDELTYIGGKTSGFENHLYQISTSDFNSSYEQFEKDVENKIVEIEKRSSPKRKIRLGYIGVPPMFSDIYGFVEDFDASFVFSEVQREFSFPRGDSAKNIYEQYHDYTYPYDLSFRLKEIRRQIELREIDGLIHYTQAFCYRQIEDIVIKKEINIPVLTIEGDKLNVLDARTKLRIEAFLDMLSDIKEMEA